MESGSQSNEIISTDEQEAQFMINTLQKDKVRMDKVLKEAASKGNEFVNRSRHAAEYSIGRKGKGHEASAAGGGRRDDDDDQERRKKDKLGDIIVETAVYCDICEVWFSNKHVYELHFEDKKCIPVHTIQCTD